MGLDLNSYTKTEWIQSAHAASKALNNFHIDVAEFNEEDEHKVLPEGTNFLVMPKNIVSVSKRGDIVERVDFKTFETLQHEDDVRAIDSTTLTATKTAIAPKELKAISWALKENTSHSVTPQIREWILTQNALHKESRLSQSQLKYLAVLGTLQTKRHRFIRLGLAWLLRDDVMEMSNDRWHQFFDPLSMEREKRTIVFEEFLHYQRALQRIGFLKQEREDALLSIGVSFEFEERTKTEVEWDRHVSELLKLLSSETRQNARSHFLFYKFFFFRFLPFRSSG